MTVAELMKILNNKHEIPSPKDAEICFYFNGGGKQLQLKLKSVGAFDISTDITFTFTEDKEPVIMKPMGIIKPALRMAKRNKKGVKDEKGG